MTVVIQRRRRSPQGHGRDDVIAYWYDRAYRHPAGLIAVDPEDDDGWAGIREFPTHSIDDVLYERVELVTPAMMYEDLGTDALASAGDVVGDGSIEKLS